jgi:hypothetical protein
LLVSLFLALFWQVVAPSAATMSSAATSTALAAIPTAATTSTATALWTYDRPANVTLTRHPALSAGLTAVSLISQSVSRASAPDWRLGAEGGGTSLDELAASGAELDPADAGGQLTRAGRAYAKAGEVFGSTSGGPAAINEAGQNALEEILTNPNTTVETMQGGRFAGGLKFVSPDGIGVVYSPDGTLEYFGRF